MLIVTIVGIIITVVYAYIMGYILGYRHGTEEIEDQYRSGDRKSD